MKVRSRAGGSRQLPRIRQPSPQTGNTNVVFRIVTAIGPIRHVASSVGQRSLCAVGGDFDGEGSTCRPFFERDEKCPQEYGKS